MRRLAAPIRKEMLQIVRDPSAILIALVLPLILLFIFSYGVNLDSNRVKIGMVLEERTPDTASLVSAYAHSRFLYIVVGNDRREFEDDLVAGTLRGMVAVPYHFAGQAMVDGEYAQLQVIADGYEPNITAFIQNYTRGVVQVWLQHQAAVRGGQTEQPAIRIESRFWYNPELKNRYFLLPGSIAIVMAMVAFVLSIVGSGLFTSSSTKTRQQAILGTFYVHGPGANAVGLCGAG